MKASSVANPQGGAQSNKLTVLLYPRVSVKVGKKALKERATTIEVSVKANHHTFQSVKHNQRPRPWPACSVSPSSPTPASSSKRCLASCLSNGESHPVVSGKSGRMNIAATATTIV